MFLLMIFMFCFFIGFVAMFFYVLHRMDEQIRGLNDEHAQLRVLLRAMESRLEKMAHAERSNALFQGQIESSEIGMAEQPQNDLTASTDPLLHLSFEAPASPVANVGRKLDITPKSKIWDLELSTPEK